MIWLLVPVLIVALCIDRAMSTVTGAVPIYRSKAVGAGIASGIVLGLYLFSR